MLDLFCVLKLYWIILCRHFVRRAKIKNIEATEEAKNKMIQDRLNSKESSMSFVPTNMAVNFVQHNRCEFMEITFFKFRM